MDQPRELGVAACPDAEDVAAYLDGQGSPDQRATLLAHFADCDRCRELLAEVRGTLDALPAPASVTRRRQVWRWAIPIAAAAAVLLVALQVYAPGPGVSPELQSIVAAAGAARPSAARLTGGFPYAAPMTAVRSGEQPRELSPDLRIALAQAEKNAAAGRTPARLHALGVGLILDGKHDAAIAALEDAAAQAPQDAAVLSDLAAAYLARARAVNRADDLARGLDAVERAVRAARAQQENPPIEALFNRALLLEALSLRPQARDAWNEYLARDGQSPWAAEAREHQQQLGSSSRREDDWENVRDRLAQLPAGADVPADVTDRFAQNLREHAQNLVADWAERTHAATPSPADTLARGDAYARALSQATGDRLLVEAIARLSRPDRARQVEGLALYAEARRASDRFEFAKARPLYERAAAPLRAAGNPMELWARFFAAQALYYARNLDAADAELAAIDRTAQAAGYLALQGRIRWLRGLARVDRGRFSEGEREYRAAIDLFERGREWDNRANIMSLIADSARTLADYRAGWSYRLPVLERIPMMRDPSRVAGALVSTALLAEAQGLQHAAIVFQDAAVTALQPQAAPAPLVQVLLRRAASLHAVNETTRAADDLDTAAALLPKIGDAGVSKRLQAERLSLAADLHDPATADRELTSALDLSAQAGLTNRLPALLLKRARVRRALGDAAAARADLLEGVALFERGRSFAPGADLRVSYFDKSWVLFSELVDLAREQGDLESAFQFSERGRGRWLRDRLDGGSGADLDRAHLRAQLPDETRVLYVTLLPQHVLTWVLWRGGEHLAVTPTSGPALASLAQQFVSRLDSSWPSASLPHLSARLYETLIRPVQQHLPDGAPLIVVPDPQIATLPFAALRDAAGSYLLERHPIGYAPTGHVLRHALDTAAQRAAVAPARVSVLATGGSARAQLRASRREIEAIARWMPASQIWSGPDATSARFQDALSREDVVHFSGHAVANPEFPALSRLEFESEPRQLLASDLQASTARARMVVLAACSTAAGAVSRGEGVMGLSRPILAAGVPTVVATLWDVEDAAAAGVFAEFYRGLALGDDSLRALQRGQLQLMLQVDPDRRDPRRWAAFANIGAPFSARGTVAVQAASTLHR